MTNSLDRVCEAVVRLVASVLSGSVAIIFLLAPEICAAASSRGDAERPNIIIILVDDLGWADLPSYGNRFHETPRLDRFAAEGMRFTSAYAAPACSPARAALMTGQSAARAGIYDWIPGHWRPFEALRAPVNRTQHLPRDLATIGEVLRARGYATAMFGKWHLGHAPEEHPLRRGFDEANVGTGYYNVCFDPPREDSSEKIMSDRLTDFALDFIERQSGAGKPFFLFLSHWDVHVPFDAEPALIDKYLKKPRVIGYPCHAAYAAMIEQLDRSTGRLLEQLDALGLEKETLVVFTSDNGGQISNEAYHSTVQHGQPGGRMKLMLDESRSHAIHAGDAREYIATSNAPLRGEKGTLYEGGIRVPLLARWCGKIPAGSTSDALAILEDWFPTLLEVAGGGSGKFTKQAIDGVSLIPVLMEAAAPHPERALFCTIPSTTTAHQPLQSAVVLGS